MFNRNKFNPNRDNEDRMFYGLCTIMFVSVVAIGYFAIKQDSAETRQALSEGRKVYHLFGQKVIV